MKVAVVFGTRPEAIKMAPVVRALTNQDGFLCRVWSTGQHRQMLAQVLDFFGLAADRDLGLMRPGQQLNDLFASVLTGIDGLLLDEKPDLVLVHGDTTTAAATAMAAFHRGVPVGHVEAGLRSGRMDQPWPEEFNRKLVDMISRHHFAPTQRARENLLREGVADAGVCVTGNTVIDALLDAVRRVGPGTTARDALDRRFAFLDSKRPMILVTGHRRESFGDGFRNICLALRRLSERRQVEVVYPVHLNPNVREPIGALLGATSSVHLIDPVDYPAFVYLMLRASIILTDSGGIQEEAPSLGKPLLVMREVTERPEAVEAGLAELVGTNPDRILAAVESALDRPRHNANANPYGDGLASARIVQELQHVSDRLR